MFIRLITSHTIPDSNHKLGIFQIAYKLRDSGELDEYSCQELKKLLKWFDDNLLAPPSNLKDPKAIYWFKDQSGRCVKKVWQLVQILRNQDITVELIKTKRPGYITYEDEHQVGAIPFNDSI